MKICYFGTYDPGYSRNAINIKGLRQNDVTVVECRVGKQVLRNTSKFSFLLVIAFYPITLPARNLYLYIKGLVLYYRYSYDVIFVAYHGHFDIVSAFLLSRTIHKPLVFDFFISQYDMYVNDRKILKKESLLALMLFKMERMSYKLSDVLVTDTKLHSVFIARLFRIPESKFKTLPIGADDDIYHYGDSTGNGKFNAVFYGQQSPLHGVQYIIQAAKVCEYDPGIQFFLIGDGQSYDFNVTLAKKLKLKNVSFSKLTENTGALEFLRTADVMLGVFQNNPKGLRSIPNKVFQGIAMGDVVLTAYGEAIASEFTHKENIYLCEPENPQAIADAILELRANRKLRKKIARNGYELYLKKFTPKATGKQLLDICAEIIQQYKK
ncbi:MAG: glycosyltransferase [Candidatus Roizmanbacteria bacterium]|nr:glycosyltransferase [Candidatus Roizmanbacteria bacterium]